MAVAQPDPVSSVMQALAGVRITVYRRDTTQIVTVFQRHIGQTQGPSAESGASGGPNPFVTGASGQVEFWCDGPAELDVLIEDTIAPARIARRTMGWNALPAANASFPTGILAQDAALGLGSLGADVARQMHQIGQVIDWWRPAITVPLPAGFEICDGRQIPAGSHDFPGLATAAINLPDLRNMFVVGADASKTHGAGAGQGNVAVDAPGIAGTGGSNAPKNFSHGHGVPGVDHLHYVSTPDHYHTASGLYTGDHAHGGPEGVNGPFHNNSDSYVTLARPWGIGAVGNIGVGGSTGGSMHSLASWSGAADRGLNSGTNSTTWNADPGNLGQTVDMRPRFIGLLKLMKVRRA